VSREGSLLCSMAGHRGDSLGLLRCAAPQLGSAELGWFVLPDQVAFNGESCFLARCLRLLRREGLRDVAEPAGARQVARPLVLLLLLLDLLEQRGDILPEPVPILTLGIG